MFEWLPLLALSCGVLVSVSLEPPVSPDETANCTVYRLLVVVPGPESECSPGVVGCSGSSHLRLLAPSGCHSAPRMG